MRGFQVGDTVMRKSRPFSRGYKIQVVTSVSGCGEYIRFNGDQFGYRISHFNLVQPVDSKPFNREDYL